MKKDELMKAFEMKLDGFTLEEIADHFDTTRQNVQQSLKAVISRNGSTIKALKNCRYKHIREYILENQVSISKIAKEAGVSETTVRYAIYNKEITSLKLVSYFIEKTGVPFEKILEKD